MKSDEEILSQAQEHIEQHLTTQEWWRTNEVKNGFNVYEGQSQWTQTDLTKYEADGIPTVSINKVAPVIDAVAGFEVQNRSDVKYQPRELTDPKQEGYVNVVQNAVMYIQQDSFAGFEKSQSFKDMLITGVGCTITSMSYLENPDGEAEVERISPYFCGWDVAARRKNLIDANHAWVAKVTTEEEINNIIEDKKGKSARVTSDPLGGLNDTRFLDFIDCTNSTVSLGIIYEYQWRERETFWRLSNKFVEILRSEKVDPVMKGFIEKYLQEAGEDYGFDPATDSVFSIFKDQKKKFIEEIEAFGLDWDDFDPTKQQRWKYYRAEIAGSTVTEKSELFSQTGFSIKFMTGKYSEEKQCWYGLLRASKEAQRAYNRAISDLQGYLNTIPKGGVHIEADAVDDIKGFIDTYSKAREVTVYKNGALSQGRMIPKTPPPMPPGIVEMVTEMSQAILDTMGVTREFMGIMDSKNMTATLNRQMVRQGLMVLASYFDALKFYTISQGMLYIDCVRIMAENAPGRLIRNIAGEGLGEYIPLTLDKIAAEYDIVVKDVPQSPDEKAEIFGTLLDLGRVMSGNGVDIMPLAIQFAPLEKEEKDKVLKMMEPPPPPPPDPNSIALVQGEIAKRQADAKRTEADARLKNLEAIEKNAKLKHVDELTQAEIDKQLRDDEYRREELQLKRDQLRLDRIKMGVEATQSGDMEGGGGSFFDEEVNKLDASMNAVVAAVDRQGAQIDKSLTMVSEAMNEFTRVMAAPKELVTNKNGRPVGVRPVLN